MQHARSRDIGRGFRAVGALAAVAIGLPFVLVRLARALVDGPSPTSGMTAPWRWRLADVTHALTSAVDQDTILTTLARVGLTVAWLAVLVLVVNVALEVRCQRTTGESLPKVAGLAWSQSLASRMAAGLLALSTMVPSHLLAAGALPPRVPAVALSVGVARDAPTAPPLAARSASASWSSHRVASGESLYGIAGRLAGGDRAKARDIAQQIVDRNLGREMPDGQRFTTPGFVVEGWTLEVPSSETSRVVEAGDCYWAIAEEHLTESLDHRPTESEVFDYTDELLDTNVPRLGNRIPASLIFPGDVVLLPVLNGSHAPPAVPSVDLPVPAPVPLPAPELPPPTLRPTTTSPPTTKAPTPMSSAIPITFGVPVSTTSPAVVPVVSRPDQVVPDNSPTAPWRQLAIGGFFAASMVGLIVRLRRRQHAARPRGEIARPASEVAAATELVVRAEATKDRVAGLMSLLPTTRFERREPAESLPRAVQLDNEGVEILWSIARPESRTAWTSSNGGWSWTQPYPERRAERPPVVLPTLVGVGRRATAELLIDLESSGSIALTGDPTVARGLLSQLVLTLAASPMTDVLDVRLVGYAAPAGEHLDDRLRAVSIHDAAAWAKARSEELNASMRRSKVSSIFHARVDHPTGDWDSVVTIVDLADSSIDDESVRELIEAARPGSGVAVVLLGNHEAANERIECAVAKARWLPSGVEFEPFVLTPEAVVGVIEVIEATAEVADESPEVVSETLDGADEGGPVATLPHFDVLVRVIGEVTVEGAKVDLSEAETELLALLACLRPTGAVNIDRLATLLSPDEWRTPNLRTVKARISSIRSKLGLGSDGHQLVPDARVGNNSPGRYTVSCGVLTDIDLLEAAIRVADRLSSSEAIEVLSEALAHVRGRPFQSRAGYEWADSEQLRGRATAAVADAAVKLIELATESRLPGVVHSAVDAASRCHDDPLTEFSYRRFEAPAAVALGDPTIVRSVLDYYRRLGDFLDLADPTLDLDADYLAAISRLKVRAPS